MCFKRCNAISFLNGSQKTLKHYNKTLVRGRNNSGSLTKYSGRPGSHFLILQKEASGKLKLGNGAWRWRRASCVARAAPLQASGPCAGPSTFISCGPPAVNIGAAPGCCGAGAPSPQEICWPTTLLSARISGAFNMDSCVFSQLLLCVLSNFSVTYH